MKKMMFILWAALLLNACTSRYASNGEAIYMQSHNGALLDVPPPLTKSNISYFYVLPQQSENPRVSIVPPGSTNA